MNFTAEYRDASGGKASVTVEAASRAAAIEILHKRGIHPAKLGVAEKGAVPVASVRGAKKVLLVVLVLVVALGIGAFLFWGGSGSGDDGGEKRIKKVGKIEKVERVQKPKVPVRKPPAKVARVAAPTNAVVAAPAEETDPAKIIKSVRYCVTNDSGKVILYYTTMDGRTHYKVRNARRPIFRNPTDKLLAMAVNHAPGRPMPPMPGLSGNGNLTERFMASLKDPIEILPEDSPADKARKEAVIAAREEMLALIGNGMTFEQALKEHQKLANENVSLKRDAQRNLDQLAASGASEREIEEYVESVNKALEPLGITPLKGPTPADDD